MRRGELWLINLDPTIGAEMRKSRPAVVVNDDAIGTLPLKVVVPVTDWKDRYAVAPWLVRLDPDERNRLVKSSAADTFQVRSVSRERLVRKTGELSDVKMSEIGLALAMVLKIAVGRR